MSTLEVLSLKDKDIINSRIKRESYQSIAERYGTSKQNIQQYIKRNLASSVPGRSLTGKYFRTLQNCILDKFDCISDFCNLVKINKHNMYGHFSTNSKFSLNDALKIYKALNPEISIEELFDLDVSKEE